MAHRKDRVILEPGELASAGDPIEAVTAPEPVGGELSGTVEPVILVTGFEPFGGHTMNPSEELAKALDGRRIGGCAVAGAVLPVHHADASTRVSLLLAELAPLAVVHLGLAEGRARIALERVALNVMDYRIPDNAGYRAEGEPCEPEGPAAYFSTLPLPEILLALGLEGIPAYISSSAGTYLCNAVLYLSQHIAREQNLKTQATFIHLPLAPSQVTGDRQDWPTLPPATCAAAVRTILQALGSQPVIDGG